MAIIPYSKQSINEDDILAVTDILRSDFLTQGPVIDEFESALAEYIGAKNAVCCSSGTAALHLAYASLGVNKSSIGIVPAITFAATANAYRYLGAEVLFCDIDPKSGLICTNHLKKILIQVRKDNPEKKVFITPVSYAGQMAPLIECEDLAREFNAYLIEDASHSIGATNAKKQRSGACEMTKAACLSFHPVKHLCCGEGGAVLTNSDTVASLAKRLRSHGITRPYSQNHETPWFYEQTELGWNYRMTEIQAALGVSQLSRIEKFIEKRKGIAEIYDKTFSKPEFTKIFDAPQFSDKNSWHLYVLRLKKAEYRNEAHKFLRNLGIMTQIHYIPVYRHPYYKRTRKNVYLQGAEDFYQRCLSIPLFPGLKHQEQEFVIESLRNFGERISG